MPQLCDPSVGSGYDIRTVQELLGDRNVATTMIYTQVLNKPGLAIRSPIDQESGDTEPTHHMIGEKMFAIK